MCGIVGLISRKTGGLYHSDLEAFQQMLIIDMLRGEDSTGAYCVTKNGDANMVKIGAHAMHLFNTKEWDTFRSQATQQGQILVGHNRKATKGAINSKNAHPFHEGKYVLVHNGTLTDHAKWKTGKEVDSHALCQAFNEHGHENVIPEIEGAFALAFYNLETEKFYMIRNTERPLHFVFAGDIIGFSSEGWMATAAMTRAYSNSNTVKVERAVSLDPGDLWEFGIKEGEDCKPMRLHKKVYAGNFTSADYEDRWENYRSQHNPNAPRSINPPFPVAPQRITQAVNNAVHHPDRLPVGTEVQFFIDKVNKERHPNTGQEQFKAVGYIDVPNRPRMDAVAWLNRDVRPAEVGEYLNSPCTAQIDWYTQSNCGTSAWLKNVEVDDDVYLWNAKRVGKLTWTQIVDKEKCTKCSAHFHPLEANFTSVNNEKYTCAKCVGDSLEADKKERFFERRNAAVQSGKPISEVAGSPVVGVIQPEGSPTVH